MLVLLDIMADSATKANATANELMKKKKVPINELITPNAALPARLEHHIRLF